jgi:hypothetical protein
MRECMREYMHACMVVVMVLMCGCVCMPAHGLECEPVLSQY